MNDPFRYIPSSAMAALASQVASAIEADPALAAAFHEGKMLGILRHEGGWEVAYSGKRMVSAEGICLPGVGTKTFVPPIYDVTVGPFREKEEEISAMNREIAAKEATGALPEEISSLKLKRAMESVKLQKWTFEQYVVGNWSGERMSVLEIFAQKGVLPPAATGDCAAPKLLHHALCNGLKPIEIGEFWVGSSPFGPVRAQGRFYPACSWKCGPLLGFMLKGLEIESSVTIHGAPSILFEDDSIIVVDKPSGMPAVPGLDGLESLETWLRSHIAATDPDGTIFQVHRLDQDTSGLMVFAKTRRAQVSLQRQFEEREVEKEYVAILCPSASSAVNMESRPIPSEGEIDLPLAPDHEDKPRQKVDMVQGKRAVTRYQFAEGELAGSILRHFGLPESAVESGLRAVVFHPQTGRSHQLRVHAAHPQGLKMPILGDTLYGGASQDSALKRLCLHASSLAFRHPLTDERMEWHALLASLRRG